MAKIDPTLTWPNADIEVNAITAEKITIDPGANIISSGIIAMNPQPEQIVFDLRSLDVTMRTEDHRLIITWKNK